MMPPMTLAPSFAASLRQRPALAGKRLSAVSVLCALLLAVAPGPSAWAQASSTGAASAAAKPSAAANRESRALTGELFYQILVGELSLRQGDTGAGFSLLLDAARKTQDAQLFSRALDVALQARSGDGALAAARDWSRAFPQDRKANSQWLDILVALGKVEDTLEPLQRELNLAPDVERNAVILALPRRFARVANKKLAADTVAQALQPFTTQGPHAAAAWSSIGRLRLAHEDTAAALQAAQQGLGADPSATAPALLALELASRKSDAALELVRQSLARQTQPDLGLAYVRLLIEWQRYDEAQAQLEALTRQFPELPEAWLVLGSMQFERGQAAQAEEALNRYVTLAQRHPNANTARGLAQAQSRRAELLARQGRLDEGRQLLSSLPSATQEQQRSRLLAEVQLLREHRQWQAAYDLLDQQNQGDPDLIYEQAMVAEKMERHDEMERLLRSVIAKVPDHHNAYNALGYSLADRNVRLQEAKQLITKALSLSPDDAFITDSLGWVEFRLGNLTAALMHLQKAFNNRPDAEIAAHLGEVLWRLKRPDEARRIWREGLQLAPHNDTLQQTLQRLQPGL